MALLVVLQEAAEASNPSIATVSRQSLLSQYAQDARVSALKPHAVLACFAEHVLPALAAAMCVTC
jgi:hypothetical protein